MIKFCHEKILKKAKSNLWDVFIPKNHLKTLAEMDGDERNNRNDRHTPATEIFIEWYKLNYKSAKRLIKEEYI